MAPDKWARLRVAGDFRAADLGRALRVTAKHRNITQQQLAEQVGVARYTVHRHFHGDTISVPLAAAYSSALHVAILIVPRRGVHVAPSAAVSTVLVPPTTMRGTPHVR